MQNEKDPELWALAKRRVAFKYHLVAYIVMSCFFWALWFFTITRDTRDDFPWPIWPMMGWGIGLLFHFLNTYVFGKNSNVQKEYEKLKQHTGNA